MSDFRIPKGLLCDISIIALVCIITFAIWYYAGFAKESVFAQERLLAPLLTMPTFVKQDENFTIIVQTSSTYNLLTISIYNSFAEYQLAPLSTTLTEGKMFITVHVPKETLPRLYNLSIILGNKQFTEPHAVKVVTEFPSSFTFIQMTDTHVSFNSKKTVNINTFRRAIEESNLINPAFVIITGDIVDGFTGDNGVAELNLFRNMLLEFQIPVYVLAGNHDYGYIVSGMTIDDYKNIVNPNLDYSFDYGNYHFTVLDSGPWTSLLGIPADPPTTEGITDAQILWFEDDLKKSENATLRFVASHVPVVDAPPYEIMMHNVDKFKELLQKYNISIHFTGHTHADAAFNINGKLLTEGEAMPRPLFLQTGSIAAWGDNTKVYRIFYVNGTNIRYAYDANDNGIPDAYSSIPVGNLRVTYDYSYIYAPKGVVSNALNENLTVTLKFKLPADSKNLTAENGTIISSIKSLNNEYIEVQIMVIVPKKGTLEVKIKS